MLEILLTLLIVAFDQLSKAAAAHWLPMLENSSLPIIEGIFHFTYVENRGAAFGIFQNARWVFIVVTVLACVGIILMLVFSRKKKAYPMPMLLRIALVLILAGAIGNFIDRVFLGYVRDMLDFALIRFAVFNVADSAICVGAVLAVISLFITKAGRSYLDHMDGKLFKGRDNKAKASAPVLEPDNADGSDSGTQDDVSSGDGPS
ncbi:MAG: signal peptidase II [Candidatus Gastranaerophilaceae bacterium]|nr:signal peptidase II [Christensenellales bacterium]